MKRITMTAIGAVALAMLPAAAQIVDETQPSAELMFEDTNTVDPMLNPQELEAEVDQGTDFATEYDEDDAQGGIYFKNEADAGIGADLDSGIETELDIDTDVEVDLDDETDLDTPEVD